MAIQTTFDGDSTDSDTTNDNDDDLSVPFEANELAELYISVAEWASLLDDLREAADIPRPKMVKGPSMDDYGKLRDRHEDKATVARLQVLAVCMKGEIGGEQSEVNDHPIGLTNDGTAPESHDDYGKESTRSYAHEFRSLPSVDWTTLSDEEMSDLEKLGMDPSELGFDPHHDGPKLLRVYGERLPLGGETAALRRAEDILGNLPEDPSAYTEDGFRESSDPDVFTSDGSGEKVAPAPEGSDDGDIEDPSPTSEVDIKGAELANDPNLVLQMSVENVKAVATNISSRRTLDEIIHIEEQNEDRTTVLKRLRQRRRAVKEDAEDTEDTDDTPELDNDELSEGVEAVTDGGEDAEDTDDVDFTEQDKALIASLIDDGMTITEAEETVVDRYH